LALFPLHDSSEYLCIGGTGNRLEKALDTLADDPSLVAKITDQFINEQIVAEKLSITVGPVNEVHIPSFLKSTMGINSDLILAVDPYFSTPLKSISVSSLYHILCAYQSLSLADSKDTDVYTGMTRLQELMKAEDLTPDEINEVSELPVIKILEDGGNGIDLWQEAFLDCVENDGSYQTRFRQQGFDTAFGELLTAAKWTRYRPLGEVFTESGADFLVFSLLKGSREQQTNAIMRLGMIGDAFVGSSPVTFLWLLTKIEEALPNRMRLKDVFKKRQDIGPDPLRSYWLERVNTLMEVHSGFLEPVRDAVRSKTFAPFYSQMSVYDKNRLLLCGRLPEPLQKVLDNLSPDISGSYIFAMLEGAPHPKKELHAFKHYQQTILFPTLAKLASAIKFPTIDNALTWFISKGGKAEVITSLFDSKQAPLASFPKLWFPNILRGAALRNDEECIDWALASKFRYFHTNASDFKKDGLNHCSLSIFKKILDKGQVKADTRRKILISLT